MTNNQKQSPPPKEGIENNDKIITEDKNYEFDDLLTLTGKFGRYQVALYAFICLVSIPAGAQLSIPIFYGTSPPFNCKTIAGNGTCSAGKCCSSCVEYDFKGSFTSAVSEWDMICDRRHLRAMSRAVYLLGILVGSAVFGAVSDHFGRKIAFFTSTGVMAVAGVVSGVADCLSMFLLFRFIAGAGTIGCILVKFVYCVEMVANTHRSWVSMINMMFLGIGGALLSLMAFLIPNWRYLMLAATIPAFLPLLGWRWIPRSPRWLIASNHLDEAYEVLMKYAEGNKVQPPVDPTHLKHLIRVVWENDARKETDNKTYGFFDVLKTPRLRKRSLILFFNWNVNAIIFHGINYNVHNLAGNLYLNVFILTTVGFPSAALNCYFQKRFGRRLTYSMFMMCCGVTCLVALSVKDYPVVLVVLVMSAQFCISICFSAIYLYTAELYPTVIRNNGVGSCGTVARIGGIVAPYIVLLSDLPNLMKTFPLLIFGVMAVAAGVMAFWLPETLTSQMPQTVEQAETWEEDYNIYCCKKPLIQATRGFATAEDETETSI